MDISPLSKKVDRSLTCNYRPVSLTCVAASYSNTLFVQTLRPTLMNINFCQTNNMYSGSGIAVKLS